MVDGVADFGGEVEEGEGAEDGAGHCGVGAQWRCCVTGRCTME